MGHSYPIHGGGKLFNMKSYEQREKERKASAKASLKKFRDREKRDREETLKKIDQLKKENREIMQRTAVHKQELSFLREVVTAHVQENGEGILDAEPVLKSFLEEEKDKTSG